MSKRICNNCGNSVLPNQRFCPDCGYKLQSLSDGSDGGLDLSRRLQQIEIQQKTQEYSRPQSENENVDAENSDYTQRRRSYVYVPRTDTEHDTHYAPLMPDQMMFPTMVVRVIAYLLDYFLIYIIASLIIPYFTQHLVEPDTSGFPVDINDWTEDQLNLVLDYNIEYLKALSLVIVSVSFIYNFLFHVLPTRATIGQLIFRFKIVQEDTFEKVPIYKILIIDVIKSVDWFLLIDLILGQINRRPGMKRLTNSLLHVYMVKKQYIPESNENNIRPDDEPRVNHQF
jgi:uncharacterized RDD family membrane protein YckC